MNVCSVGFLLLVGALGSVYGRLHGDPARRALVFLCTLVFLAPAVADLRSALTLTTFLGVTYGLLLMARRRASTALLVVGAALVVLSFLVIKRYAFLGPVTPLFLLAHPVEVVGLSYMLFKFLHVLVDLREGAILEIDLGSYLAYQLAFFTLLAGPIQRYGDFASWWRSPAPPLDEPRSSLLSWNRVLDGVLKMGLLAPAVLALYERAGAGFVQPQSTLKLVMRAGVYLYTYPVYLFLNFSGYSDIVIGSAMLLGLKLPENFNRPYLARNLVDFWSRWHMSLSTWIRDYVFMSSYKAVATRLRSGVKIAGYLLLFGSLFVAGVWHGASWNFVLFGLFHGIGVAVTQVWGDALRQSLGKKGLQRYLENRWITLTARTITLHAVAVSFLLFPPDLPTTLARLRAVAERL